MEHKQALAVIKEVLDAAVKGGIFPNMDASFTAAQAYNIIANVLVDKEKNVQID
jgi:hemoglobin-like flavoprotein